MLGVSYRADFSYLPNWGLSDEDRDAKHVSVAVAIAGMLPGLAAAHVGHGDAGSGLWAGILHPIFGPDHVVAMVAVGIWAAQRGAPCYLGAPHYVPVAMALGAVLGALDAPIPGIELGIALSAIALGLMVALSIRLPLRVAGLLVAVFAIFHGYAHGAELPGSANAISYLVGFVLATECCTYWASCSASPSAGPPARQRCE